MLNNYFTFNGERSIDFGVGISGSGTFNKPARRVERLTVPGRNGDLLIEGGSFENLEYSFPSYIVAGMPRKIDEFAAFLLSTKGYQRLTDTYHPEHFRLAVYSDGLEVDAGTLNDYGRFDVVFDVKPQKFLISGEEKTVLTAAGMIENPTRFSSRPLLRVYGTGTLGIGAETIQILSADEYTDIDCDAEEAYRDSYVNNCNGNIIISGSNFPVLHSGNNNISMEGITRVEITPRWWTL